MRVRSSHRFIGFEVAALFTLLAMAVLWLPAPHSMAQQDNRQLRRDAAQSSERRIALVIGNGGYQHVGALKNPPNDATLLAATLRKLGFEVTVGTDKSQREMKQMIREFGQRLRGSGGVGLFYFAGHGVQAKGKNFLIPVDAEIQSEIDLEDAAVDVNYVLGMMDDAQNALNIAILDACRNNPFARSLRSASDGLAQVKAPTGTLIAYATSPDRAAADGGGANSPYAEELSKQMAAPGLVLETMFRRVTEQVSARTGGRQEPWVSDNHKGDFYFSNSPTTSGLSNIDRTQPATIDAVAVERETWEAIRGSNDAQDYKDYLQAYPNGAYAIAARAKLRQLEAAKNTPTNTQPTKDAGNTSSASTDSSGDSLAGTVWKSSVNTTFKADGTQDKKSMKEQMKFQLLAGDRLLAFFAYGSGTSWGTPIEGTWKTNGNTVYMRIFQRGSNSCAFEYRGEVSNGQIVGRTTYSNCSFSGYNEWRLQPSK